MAGHSRAFPLSGPVLRGWRLFVRSGLVVPLLFVAFVLWYGPLQEQGELDYDEGVNVIKAALHAQGFGLYSEIWSDQPPVLTLVLSRVLRAYPGSLPAARGLILVFSALLLWMLFLTLRRELSPPAAVASVLLLCLSERYIRLSGSVMVGLPALALAMLAVFRLSRWRSSRHGMLLAGSAAAMALSMQTKMFTGLLIPVCLGNMLIPQRPADVGHLPVRRRALYAAAWLGMVILFAGFIGLVCGSFRWDQIIAPHVGRHTSIIAGGIPNGMFLVQTAARHAVYLPVAVVGIVWAFRRRLPSVILPATWLAVAVAVLCFHKPLWYHHAMLVTIPLSWLCGYGVQAWLCGLRTDVAGGNGAESARAIIMRRRMLQGAGAVLVAGLLLYPLPLPLLLGFETFGGKPEFDMDVVEHLRRVRGTEPTLVFTDRPMYPFLAHCSVPPEVAVMTLRRIGSGALSESVLGQTMERYKPHFVVLDRFPSAWPESFLQQLAGDYLRVDTGGRPLVYRRRDGHSEHDPSITHRDGQDAAGTIPARHVGR